MDSIGKLNLRFKDFEYYFHLTHIITYLYFKYEEYYYVYNLWLSLLHANETNTTELKTEKGKAEVRRGGREKEEGHKHIEQQREKER